LRTGEVSPSEGNWYSDARRSRSPAPYERGRPHPAPVSLLPSSTYRPLDPALALPDAVMRGLPASPSRLRPENARSGRTRYLYTYPGSPSTLWYGDAPSTSGRSPSPSVAGHPRRSRHGKRCHIPLPVPGKGFLPDGSAPSTPVWGKGW